MGKRPKGRIFIAGDRSLVLPPQHHGSSGTEGQLCYLESCVAVGTGPVADSSKHESPCEIFFLPSLCPLCLTG